MAEISASVERGFILSIAEAAADLGRAGVALMSAKNDLEVAVLGMLGELEGEDAAEWVRLRADTEAAMAEIGALAVAAAETRNGMAVRGAVLMLGSGLGSCKTRDGENSKTLEAAWDKHA